MNQFPLDAGESSIRIAASHPNFARGQVALWKLTLPTTNVVIVLTNGYPVFGRVRTADGEPIAGALVCKNTEPGWSARTDADGRFNLGLVEGGKMNFQVLARGFQEIRSSVVVTDRTDELSLEMQPIPAQVAERNQPLLVRISGTVVDEETGAPIPRFKVVQGEGPERPFVSGEAALSGGEFVGEGEDGQFDWTKPFRYLSLVRFQVEAEGYQHAVSTARNLREGDQAFEFKLKRARLIRGVVRTSAGRPAAQAKVTLCGMGFGATMQHPGKLLPPNGEFKSVRATADAEGRFSIPRMTGAQSVVAVHEFGYAYATLESATAKELLLQPWGAIEGTLKVGGRPAADQFVFINGTQELPVYSRFALSFSYRPKTDAAGRFQFSQVPAGQHVLSRLVNYRDGETCSPLQSHTRSVTVRPGETAQVELSGQGRAVIGRVALAQPQSNVSWNFSKAFLQLENLPAPAPRFEDFKDRPGEHGRAQLLYDAQTKFPFAFNADGTISADDVPPGNYILEIEIAAPTDEPGMGGMKKLGTLKKKVVVSATAAASAPPLDLGVLLAR